MTVSDRPVHLPNGGGTYENGVHEALLGDPSKLTQPIKDVKDKYELLPAFLKVCSCGCLMMHSCSDACGDMRRAAGDTAVDSADEP